MWRAGHLHKAALNAWRRKPSPPHSSELVSSQYDFKTSAPMKSANLLPLRVASHFP